MRIRKRLLITAKVLCIIAAVLLACTWVLFSIDTKVTGNADSYAYSLPYKAGTRHRVVQGYGGLFSHQHIAALDFEMPPGTPVCAAREGVVYSYKDDSDAGGFLPKYKNMANYIIIKHPDGSFGCYWHLQKNGVLVKRGPVAKGQPIALSGATGQVLRPHLHFSVKSRLRYHKDAFVKTQFVTTRGLVFLKTGKSYERPAD